MVDFNHRWKGQGDFSIPPTNFVGRRYKDAHTTILILIFRYALWVNSLSSSMPGFDFECVILKHVVVITCLSSRNVIQIRQMTQDTTDDESTLVQAEYDDVIKFEHFPHHWPFVPGIHRSPVNSPHKGQRGGAFMFSLICAWINGWLKQSSGWWFETPSCSLWRHCSGCHLVTNHYLRLCPRRSTWRD